MNKIKWGLGLLCIMAVFAMIGCENPAGGTDNSAGGGGDTPTIEQPKIINNLKPSDTDTAKYHGFLVSQTDSDGFLIGIIAVKNDAIVTHEQVVQNWIADMKKIPGIADSTLSSEYSPLAGSPEAGKNNEYAVTFTATSSEGYTGLKKDELKIKLTIGKESDTLLVTDNNSLKAVFNDYNGDISSIKQAVIDGFNIDYKNNINGNFLLHQLIPSSKNNKVNAITFLITIGANVHLDTGASSDESNSLGLVSEKLKTDGSNADLIAIKEALIKSNAFLKRGHPYETVFFNKVKGKKARGTPESAMGTAFTYTWIDNGDMILNMAGLTFTHEFQGVFSENSAVYYGATMGSNEYGTVEIVSTDKQDGRYGNLIFKFEE